MGPDDSSRNDDGNITTMNKDGDDDSASIFLTRTTIHVCCLYGRVSLAPPQRRSDIVLPRDSGVVPMIRNSGVERYLVVSVPATERHTASMTPSPLDVSPLPIQTFPGGLLVS